LMALLRTLSDGQSDGATGERAWNLAGGTEKP